MTGTITEPGVYQLTDEQYHTDPVKGGSLSSTGARRLLPPSCPAKFRHWRDHDQPHKRSWDIGHAAHLYVLGSGPELAVIDAENWRTKAAQQARDEAYAAGLVPLLTHEHTMVVDMAEAIRRHPVASLLFDPTRGRAEQTLVWRDTRTGVWCRARLDWLPGRLPGQRLIIPDYKTAVSGDLDALARSMNQFGYHQQDAWYQAGCKALGLADNDTAFVFVCQEKDTPYLVTIVEMDATAHRIGSIRNRRALDLYARCVAEDRWPAYSDEIELLSLPRCAEIEEGEHLP